MRSDHSASRVASLGAAALESLESRWLLSLFTVTSAADSGPGTLRQAILDANATGGADEVAFAVPGAGAHTITLLAALPAVSDSLSIDGSTQEGYEGRPLIHLHGQPAGGAEPFNGLDINAANCRVIGLALDGFAWGITLSGGGASRISGCFIGLDAGGISGSPNRAGIGIYDSPNNQIGGFSPLVSRRIDPEFLGNVICNCTESAAIIVDGYQTGAEGNRIQGNLIGLDITGRSGPGNAQGGIFLQDARMTLVGGTIGWTGNTLGRNAVGIQLQNAANNRIRGNFIGTDPFGKSTSGTDGALGNSADGIDVMSGDGNVIGGTTATARNVISGNGGSGIGIGFEAYTRIYRNHIGIDRWGSRAVPNLGDGVLLSTYSGAVIGGAGLGNVIAANREHGIRVNGSLQFISRVTIQGNRIGASALGGDLGNGGDGVHLDAEVPHVLVGGSGPGEGNLIAYNHGSGVALEGTNASAGNSIFSNSIFSNHRLGIDLGDDDATANDYHDADEGANGLQNFPGLTSAGARRITIGGEPAWRLSIAGLLNSRPGTSYTLQFFGNTPAGSSGDWQGRSLLGTRIVHADENGRAAFTFTISTWSNPGVAITATATDSAGSTSEISAARRLG